MSSNLPPFEYVIIPSESASETSFFLDLLKKMKKKASTISLEELEDFALTKALKESAKSPKGNLSKVKAHLAKVASSK